MRIDAADEIESVLIQVDCTTTHNNVMSAFELDMSTLRRTDSQHAHRNSQMSRNVFRFLIMPTILKCVSIFDSVA